MEVDIVSVLRFFDEAPLGSRHHATAVTALAGEELGIGLLLHYFRRESFDAEALPIPCTQGKPKGKRLDKWVRCTVNDVTVYYQVEVKNWSAHAIGGKTLKINASSDQIYAHKIERWSKEWDGTSFRKDHIKKVLIPMKAPVSGCAVEPLACYWDAMHPDGMDQPFFSVSIENNDYFTRVHVFSMSAYLRDLHRMGTDRILLDMPDLVARLEWIKRLFQ